MTYIIKNDAARMNPARIDALIASAYNLHVGPTVGGEAMTPRKAAFLPRGDRAHLCRLLEELGGCDIYDAADARAAFAAVVA